MKYGFLRFGYDSFAHFNDQRLHMGYYSANLGDNAQSIATRALLQSLGIADNDIVAVNRDTLPCYEGEPVAVIMNAVFNQAAFPLPDNIIPVFVGFNAPEEVIRTNSDLLKRHEPIGCRDEATAQIVRSLGISAVTTGCLTLTLPTRLVEPPKPKLLVVYGIWAGELPSEVLKYIPPELSDTAEFIFHRLPVFEHPLSEDMCRNVGLYERSLLDRYKNEATLVLTPLHHVAAPCVAMGIPVVLCRRHHDTRFGFLESFMPVYYPDAFSAIDWYPSRLNIVDIQSRLISFTQEKMAQVQRGGLVKN